MSTRSARVWRAAPGQWEWDVRLGGSRSTGTTDTWRKAYDSALEDLAWLSQGGTR
jgi:hypothetical protein